MPVRVADLIVKVGADISQAESGLRRVQQQLKSAAGAGREMGGVFEGVLGANIAMGLANRLQNTASQALDAYGAYERLGMSLQSLSARELIQSGSAATMAAAMEQSSGRAQELLGWVEKLAIQSPFSQSGVADALRTAQAYGFTSQQAQRLTKALIDFSAGSGASEASMSQIALALGQIQAKGKLAGQEVIQLTNTGINVWQILGQSMGKTTAEVIALSEKGLIPANTAIEAIVGTLERDFAGAAARQAVSVAGLRSSLEDITEVGLREYFGATFREIQPYVDEFVTSFTEGDLKGQIREAGEELGAWVGDVLPKMKELATTMASVDAETWQLAAALGGVVVLGPSVLNTAAGIAGGLANIASWIGKLGPVIPMLSDLVQGTILFKSATDGSTLAFGAGATAAAAYGAILGSVVAVAYQFNEQIIKTNRAGEEAVNKRWDEMFAAWESEGVSAVVIADRYASAIERVNKAYDAVNPVIKVFMGNQENLYGDLNELNEMLIEGSGIYSTYMRAINEVADARGLEIDASGRLYREMMTGAGIQRQYIDGVRVMGEEAFVTARKIEAMAEADRVFFDRLLEQRDILQEGDYDPLARWSSDKIVQMGVTVMALGEAAGYTEEQIKLMEGGLSGLNKALEEAGWNAEIATDVTRWLGVELGITSRAELGLARSSETLNEALALGVINSETYVQAMQGLADGSVPAHGSMLLGIERALGLAQAQNDARAAAENLALAQLGLSEALKGASQAEFANTAVQELGTLYDEGKISFEDYATAWSGVQETFGLADEKSRALSEGLLGINQALSDGYLPADQYDEALLAIYQGAQDGVSDLEDVLGKFGEFPAVMEEAGTAADTLFLKFGEPDWAGAGTDIIAGVEQGVIDEIPALIAAVELAADQALAAMRNRLLVRSPSKAFADGVGAPMMQGVAQGVERNAYLPAQAVANTAGVLLAQMQAMTSRPTVSVQASVANDVDIYRLANLVAREIRRGRL